MPYIIRYAAARKEAVGFCGTRLAPLCRCTCDAFDVVVEPRYDVAVCRVLEVLGFFLCNGLLTRMLSCQQ